MAKTQTCHVCQECGRVSARAMGRCPGCGAWDSLIMVAAIDHSVTTRTMLAAAVTFDVTIRRRGK
ncbi:hypothetical protein ADN00_12695 [Ornatilinea apprima]|uniref:LapB rubredoxin metal binding domain-containing protein n=1 Tax=Ornatilinea apprima TaxID=1134406 RepID=A0A0P6WZZ1_9CHLR|nr:hypothetical protein [Ornatilinea apprima]KPL75501.1 hypothetical protein ADN00_12695 [Ornatilinea apprima]